MTEKEIKSKSALKPSTKKELADLYEMKHRAFFSLFKPYEETIGKKMGRYYSTKQVELVFDCLGLPPCLLDDKYVIKEENKLKINSSIKTDTLISQ